MKLNNSDKVMQDSALKLASAAYVKEEGERLLKEANELNQTENEEISKEEIEEFEKFCKKEFRRNEWKSSNVLKIVATVAMLAIVINIGIELYHNAGGNNSIKNTNTTEYYRGDDVNIQDLRYIPEYIPECLEIYDLIKIQQSYVVSYKNEGIEWMDFSQMKINDNMVSQFEDMQEIKVVDIKGTIGKLQTGDQYTLTWIADNHIFCIKAQGIAEEELIKIAESVKEN